jgi:putative Holliday junction resolvase
VKPSVLAVDHGTERTGFACTDPLRIATRPLDTFHGPGDAPELVERVVELVEERDARVVLVGLPYSMDGSVGPRARDVLAFMARVRDALPGVEVLPQDERLSTKEAEALLIESGYFGKERKARRDSWSALILLRDWIEQGEPRREWPPVSG